MNDTFSIVATAMPRRQVDPFWIRCIVVGVILALLAGGFAMFVTHAQSAADARRVALEATIRRQDQAQAEELARQAETAALDQQATANTDVALERARAILTASGSLAAAGPVGLSRSRSLPIFVDGPSTAPSVVSVVAAGSSWAAATMGPSGTCYWVLLRADGTTSYGTGSVCTGRAALGAVDPSW
ncbi:MAG TPA: hypothetical protein VK646_07660 [Actinomycetota bacterium]|nr:hypothetical protein [Actinomycetota bacterium]